MNTITGVLIMAVCGAGPLQERIVHNDPASYQRISAAHAGAGEILFRGMLGSSDLSSNFLFLHAGMILPKGGIGHHFHHEMEEMYVILEGEAEFTISGRTARLKGPVAVPCKLGQSHGIYNPTGKPIRWLNFAVSASKGKADSFDLNDDRVGATLDPKPVFVSRKLDPKSLEATEKFHDGNGTVQYRRVLPASVFRTDWSYLDHLVIPPGSSAGPRTLVVMEEVYYVIQGAGALRVNGEQAMIREGDAIPIQSDEEFTIANKGNQKLELLVIGIEKETTSDQPGNAQAMLLEIYFKVAEERAEEFERMYAESYVPAMRKQQGYLRSNLLRLFRKDVAEEIEASPTEFNYQMQLVFDTEENRRKWVASKEHETAWPLASSMAEKFSWRGFDVVAKDRK